MSAALLAGAIYVFSTAEESVKGPQIPGADKVGHFLAYGAFSFLLCRSIKRPGARTLSWWALAAAVVVASAYGAGMEVVQSYYPNRECSFWDFMADLAGAGVFAFIYRWAVRRTRYVA